MRAMFSTLLFALLSHSAFAANDITPGENAGEMADNCRPILSATSTEPGNLFVLDKNMKCWGAFSYVQWIYAVVVDKKAPALTPAIGACLPQESSRKQLIAIFVSYVDKHPELMHRHYAEMTTRAFQEVFPCRNK